MPISVFLGVPRVSLRGGVLRQAAQLSSRPLGHAQLLTRAPRTYLSTRCDLRVASQRLFSVSSFRRNELKPSSPKETKDEVELHESPYTIPNALTLVRIAACPYLAYSIVQGNYELATGILVASGLTDWLDGYLARKWNQKSVLGSILDPMADKALMTTLVVALTYQGLLPLPLAILIFGRDLGLSLWAFYLRWKSLPPPRTPKRYFDMSMPSAEVKPTQISKVNTALQLALMAVTTVSPLLTAYPLAGTMLQGLQCVVAGTTIWSGLSYVGTSGFKILKQPGRKPPSS